MTASTRAESDGDTSDVAAAFAWCRDFARARQENFSVVTWLLPHEVRPHFHSLYTFCRITDDLGDEADGDRLQQLNDWEAELHRCYAGERNGPALVALGTTIDHFQIPPDPFLRLIEANRMDQRITRFATYDDLLDYCSYSAAPVGRMVLYVLGYSDERRQLLSDSTCVALQLTNFLQDVTLDWEKGRVYLPQADLDRFGVSERDIADRRFSLGFSELMRFEVHRARELFNRGRELESLIDKRARLDVRLFRLGGEATLDAIEDARYDVLKARPHISKARKAWMALSNGARIKSGI
ncbi:MAG: squalene synthase HpnC [Tepidiformaceae bacterium]